MNSTFTKRFWILTIIVMVVAALRVILIEIPNAAPIAAIALFGGAYFTNKKMAFIIPALALLFSDIILEITFQAGMQPYPGFYGMMAVVYASFLLIVLIGFYLRKRIKPGPIVISALAASVLFFLITNFAVWVMGGTYPMTFTGLIICYEAGIPFFKNTLISNLLFTAVLFGGFEFVKSRFPVLAKA